MRSLTYAQAISEALVQALELDPAVHVFGIGVDDPKAIFGTTKEAAERFGPSRVFDTPCSESALTGLALGAASQGLRPLLVHARNDFMLYSFDQLINHAAKWQAMYGGRSRAPIAVRAIVGKGWGQGPQHSQSLHAMLAHVPGLRVALPSTPADAKACLAAALTGDAPTIVVEHRRLYDLAGEVPQAFKPARVGEGAVRRKGRDVTIAAVSLMAPEALAAAELLEKLGISAEVVDPVWARPLDKPLLLKSLKKTGRLVVADTSWKACGLSAELAAVAAEEGFASLKAPLARVALPDLPAPTAWTLEEAYHPGAAKIAAAAARLFGKTVRAARAKDQFVGPF